MLKTHYDYFCYIFTENVDMQDGKITEKGFIELNQMEADDNDGDTDDLWVTLTCMGFNKGLVMDEVCAFDFMQMLIQL